MMKSLSVLFLVLIQSTLWRNVQFYLFSTKRTKNVLELNYSYVDKANFLIIYGDGVKRNSLIYPSSTF